MWHTNNGDRTLEGVEARLFAEAIWSFVQELEIEEGDYDVDLEVFDRLTFGQKASLLYGVLSARVKNVVFSKMLILVIRLLMMGWLRRCYRDLLRVATCGQRLLVVPRHPVGRVRCGSFGVLL